MKRIGCTSLVLLLVSSVAVAAPTKEQLERQKQALKGKEAAAKQRAERDVTGGRFRDADLFKPGQKDIAIRERTRQLFGRTQRRLAKAVDDAIEFIQQGEPHNADVVLKSWGQNRRMSTERQGVRHVRSAIQRVGLLPRDSQYKPGTNGAEPEPTVWKPGVSLSPAEMYSGPWTAKDEKMTLPGKDTVLTLGALRDLDADGMHPSATGLDKNGTEFKVKFNDGHDLSAAAIVGRLVTAMGYHSPQATYLMPELKVSPQLVVAAYRFKQRIGVRVREDGALSKIGITPGKYGYSPLKMDPRQIKSLTLRGGKQVAGDEAIALLKQAGSNPKVMDSIEHVTLKNVQVQTEENEGHAVGPWDLDAIPARDMKAVRGYSVIASWLEGADIRLSNNQMIVKKTKDGKVKLQYVFSDAGSALEYKDPGQLTDTVNVNPRGRRIHSDSNKIVNRAFDRTTQADARWGMERIASLSAKQIEAAVASGVASYPLAKFMTARLIARRNDIVRKLGYRNEYGMLPVPDLSNVKGGGKITLPGADGTPMEIELPEGGFQVQNGQLVAVQ